MVASRMQSDVVTALGRDGNGSMLCILLPASTATISMHSMERDGTGSNCPTPSHKGRGSPPPPRLIERPIVNNNSRKLQGASFRDFTEQRKPTNTSIMKTKQLMKT